MSRFDNIEVDELDMYRSAGHNITNFLNQPDLLLRPSLSNFRQRLGGGRN